MFKDNNKDTGTYFTLFSSVSILDFEHVNISWDTFICQIYLVRGFAR